MDMLEQIVRAVGSSEVRQADLAKQSGVDKATVSRVVASKCEPSYRVVKSLSDALLVIRSRRQGDAVNTGARPSAGKAPRRLRHAGA